MESLCGYWFSFGYWFRVGIVLGTGSGLVSLGGGKSKVTHFVGAGRCVPLPAVATASHCSSAACVCTVVFETLFAAAVKLVSATMILLVGIISGLVI